MFFIRFCLIWSLISLHVVGGAILFRRFFPKESVWFGFIVPALSLVVFLNFIEHMVALPTLRWLLPVTSLGSIWLVMSPEVNWKRLRLPTLIFLAAFAFTFSLRFLKPDIAGVRDGIYDLQFIASFCMGQSLPVDSTWVPPNKLIYYYAFGHYGVSVLIRLFGFDVGTGFNVGAALIAAWILFMIAAVASLIGRRKLWITILAPILAAGGATGSSGYLWLMVPNVDPEDIATLYSRVEDPEVHLKLFQWLKPVYMYDRHELFSPGWWSWMGIFHSTSIGNFIVMLATLSIVEIVRKRRANWPWICCAGAVPLMLIASTWGFPYVTVLVFTGLAWAWYIGRVPLNPRWTAMGFGLLIVCLTPMMVYYLTSSSPPHSMVSGEEHTQVLEFFVQWWPIYLPMLALLVTCRTINPAVGVVMFVTPIAFAAVEIFSVGARFDMTGKIWGFIFCAAWAVLIPAIATSRYKLIRALFVLMVINGALTFCYWTTYTWRTIDWDKFGDLEGKGDLRSERPKARILNALLPYKNEIISTGMSSWSFCTSARIAAFSGNRDYITWSFNCDNDNFRNCIGEGERREKVLNAFYEGKDPHPLLFLRENNIVAVVIWPEDDIKDDVLAKLKQQLAPLYQYQDLRETDNQNPPNCGIFLYHPNLARELPPEVSQPPAAPAPPPPATNAPPTAAAPPAVAPAPAAKAK